MGKTEILRARVSQELKSQFEEICSTFEGKPSAEVLREIVEGYVKANIDKLANRIVINIFRPENYDFGAWRVYVKLRNPGESEVLGLHVPFHLPKLPHLRFVSDHAFSALTIVNNHYELGGIFIDGEWRGDLYCYSGDGSIQFDIADIQEKLFEHIERHLNAIESNRYSAPLI